MSQRRRGAAVRHNFVSASSADVRPPPALTHGLTSRRVWDAMRDDVEALTPALIGAAYPDPPVVDAARAAAEAILHLDLVRRSKYAVIEKLRRQPAEFRGTTRQVLRNIRQIFDGKFGDTRDEALDRIADLMNGTQAEDEDDVDPELNLASILARAPKELRRMAEYERRGISRRERALRRLACERIEAERRRRRG